MEKIKGVVKKNIREYRNDNYSCSQATFLGICKSFGSNLTNEQLMALSVGFRGGIGRSYNEGTCGALSAGIMALGIYLPTQSEKALLYQKNCSTILKKNKVL